jgi:hypothetical protein
MNKLKKLLIILIASALALPAGMQADPRFATNSADYIKCLAAYYADKKYPIKGMKPSEMRITRLKNRDLTGAMKELDRRLGLYAAARKGIDEDVKYDTGSQVVLLLDNINARVVGLTNAKIKGGEKEALIRLSQEILAAKQRLGLDAVEERLMLKSNLLTLNLAVANERRLLEEKHGRAMKKKDKFFGIELDKLGKRNARKIKYSSELDLRYREVVKENELLKKQSDELFAENKRFFLAQKAYDKRFEEYEQRRKVLEGANLTLAQQTKGVFSEKQVKKLRETAAKKDRKLLAKLEEVTKERDRAAELLKNLEARFKVEFEKKQKANAVLLKRCEKLDKKAGTAVKKKDKAIAKVLKENADLKRKLLAVEKKKTELGEKSVLAQISGKQKDKKVEALIKKKDGTIKKQGLENVGLRKEIEQKDKKIGKLEKLFDEVKKTAEESQVELQSALSDLRDERLKKDKRFETLNRESEVAKKQIEDLKKQLQEAKGKSVELARKLKSDVGAKDQAMEKLKREKEQLARQLGEQKEAASKFKKERDRFAIAIEKVGEEKETAFKDAGVLYKQCEKLQRELKQERASKPDMKKLRAAIEKQFKKNILKQTGMSPKKSKGEKLPEELLADDILEMLRRKGLLGAYVKKALEENKQWAGKEQRKRDEIGKDLVELRKENEVLKKKLAKTIKTCDKNFKLGHDAADERDEARKENELVKKELKKATKEQEKFEADLKRKLKENIEIQKENLRLKEKIRALEEAAKKPKTDFESMMGNSSK